GEKDAQRLALQSRETNVRFGSKADIDGCERHVRFTPKSRHPLTALERPLSAKSGHQGFYSITSLARMSRLRGITWPSFFAVLRLMTNSRRVGSWMGRSAGLVPLKMRSM